MNLNNTKHQKSTIFTLVDFSSFSESDDPVAQLETAKEIDRINRHHGFVCLRNSGIPKERIQSAFDASKQLFEMSEASKKEQLKPLDPMTNTGYLGNKKEALNRNRSPDLKEAFNIRNTSIKNGDLIGTPPMFEDVAISLWDDLKTLGSKFAVCCALALGLEDKNYFSKTLETMDLCTLRLLHYPPCDASDITEKSSDVCAIRVGEHTDFGIFTFLFIHDIHHKSSLGLQVKEFSESGVKNHNIQSEHVGSYSDMLSSSWSDLQFDEKSLELIENDSSCAVLVNTGALMARWTNDVWRATAHRVIVSPKSFQDHRYSIAMFFDPDKETLCSVHPKFVQEGHDPKYSPIRSIDYLLMKLKESQELKRISDS